MKFEESEYKGMRFNIRKLNDDDEVISKFPELLVYKDVFLANDLSGLDPDFVLRYLIYMYDLGSPARVYDLKKRKAWAMNELGRKVENYTDAETDMLLWKNRGVNRRMVYFCLLIGGENYLVWKREEEKLMRLSEQVIEFDNPEFSIDEKKKAADTEKLYGQILNEVMGNVKKYREAFLQGETSRELEDELTEFTMRDTLGIRPEEYIRDMEQNGDIFTDIEP
jgi:hypothetical protein